MRVSQHVTDTKAVKATINAIPDHWVVRDLSERDYGIDLTIEIFRHSGTNIHGDYYDATGETCYLQLKGTITPFVYNRDGSLSYSMDKDSLLYVEKFSIPFVLVRVCVAEGHQKIHFLWLQRYIMDVLDFEVPDWREGTQDSYTLRIPAANVLPEKSLKIENIASRIKYVEEHVEYFERLTTIKPLLLYARHGELEANTFQDLRKEARRIKRLRTLLSRNNCCIRETDVDDLMNFIDACEKGVTYELAKDEDYPHQYNFELLYDENMYRISMETFIAENEDETLY